MKQITNNSPAIFGKTTKVKRLSDKGVKISSAHPIGHILHDISFLRQGDVKLVMDNFLN